MKKQSYFLENKRKIPYFVTYISIIAMFYSFYLLFYYVSPYASTWDQVDFALALNRFDLLAMQPHFPGYPYFILGGTFMHFIIENEAMALATLNALLLLLSSIPIYLLLRPYSGKAYCLLGVTILLSSSYLLITAAQPMSEGSAIAILWWFLWSIDLAKKSDKYSFQFIPLLFYSILLGIRLSYFPFGIGIIMLWWIQLKKRHYMKLAVLLVSAVLFQIIWIGALIIAEGGIKSFFNIAIAFTGGHFGEWGGAITANNDTLIARLYQLVVYDFIWTGICAQSLLLLSIWCALIVTASYFFIKNKYKLDYWFAILGGSYFIWVLFGQNIDKPRHILPSIGIFLFYLIVILLKSHKNRIIPIMLICLITQLSVNYSYLKEQATVPPTTYQMSQYIEKLDGEVVLYTWEETRVLEYLNAPFIHKRIFTYNFFLQDKMNYQYATILMTNHVVEGFEMQGINMKEHIEKVAEFQSNKVFDPVYHQISIYKWKK